jgi:hypothetical protein
MTEPPAGGRVEEFDTRVDRALSDALRTQSLDSVSLVRMHAAVVQEWQMSVGSRAVKSRRWMWGALAAAMSLTVIALGWFAQRAGAPDVLGSMSRLDRGSAQVRFSLVRHRVLTVGDELRAGDTLTARGSTLVLLSGGGTLRIAANSVIDVRSADEICLESGLIYVDLPSASIPSGGLHVLTQAGTLEHVGTAFEVLSGEQLVRVRVREGRVRLRSAVSDVVAVAGTELLATPGDGVSRHSIATYGPEWQWVSALAPDYEIEERPLLDFLQWVSREVGRHLDFADAPAREVAEHAILHGTVRGQPPLQALANVLPTTSLVYEMRGDTIWVKSGRGT